MFQFNAISQLVQTAKKHRKTISRIVLKDQSARMGISEEEFLGRMRANLAVMRAAAVNGLKKGVKSISGLSGGDGRKMDACVKAGGGLGGTFYAKALRTAIAVSEYNASMGKIVAAPTAGSCGILPAALLTMMDEKGVGEEEAVLALVTAGALGKVIATEASISGAEGGCQAECGSAAAMAAGAMVELAGGTPDMVGHACAIAIKNQLGLVCDPVAGLVEVPCIKRNAGGIACAIAAADMALAGIESKIPVDEVVAAMRDVGEMMPSCLRETAQGGLAVTPTGLAIKERIFGPERREDASRACS